MFTQFELEQFFVYDDLSVGVQPGLVVSALYEALVHGQEGKQVPLPRLRPVTQELDPLDAIGQLVDGEDAAAGVNDLSADLAGVPVETCM